jgi:hypothetical protein
MKKGRRGGVKGGREGVILRGENKGKAEEMDVVNGLGEAIIEGAPTLAIIVWTLALIVGTFAWWISTKRGDAWLDRTVDKLGRWGNREEEEKKGE